MPTKLEYICRSLSKGTTKVYETYVVNAIWQKLNNENIEFVTQQYVFKDGKRSYIDMYFPQIRLAVEVDEMYHNSDSQTVNDNQRMSRIQTASLDSLISDKVVEFFRIKIGNDSGLYSIDFINKQIDECVAKIQSLYKGSGSPKWVYGTEEVIKIIKKRKQLKRGDSLSKMTEIMDLFGKNYKAAMRCYYKVSEYTYVWSPRLASSFEEDIQWNNTVNEDLSIIVERDRDGLKKTAEGCKWTKDNNVRRIVFLHYRDPLGSNGRKFLGVYKSDHYNEDTHEETWVLDSDTFDLKEFLKDD